MPRQHLFNFILRPIEEVAAWGNEGGLNLHWWGLTDGWYWMDVGEHRPIELMRYSDELIRATPEWRWEKPYIDYQVVRLYEDVLQLLPAVMDPIPSDLADLIRTPAKEAEFTSLADRWVDRFFPTGPGGGVRTEEEVVENSRRGEFWERLFEWWSYPRHLSSGHAAGQHDISMWTEGSSTTIRWRNDCGVHGDSGAPWVDVPDGELSMPFERFMDEVRSFHDRLMAAMAERVKVARAAWPRPDVAVDIPELVQAQHDRSNELARAIAVAPNARTDWNSVREAVAEAQRLDRHPGAQMRRFPWQDQVRPQSQHTGERPALVTNPHHAPSAPGLDRET